MTSPSGGSVMLVSDVHSRFGVLEAQIAHAREDLGRDVDRVLVLGDFGLFGSDLHDYFRRDRRRFAVPVAFIEGNHEDFRAFDDLVRDYADVVTHLPRNSVQEIGDGRWLCIGGARYMDSWSTPPGSEISDRDIARCVANPPGSVDVVVSHDCPADIGVTSDPGLGHLGTPGVPGLTRVASHLRPRLWVFGHHHRWHDVERGGTRFVGLAQSWQGYALLEGGGELELVKNEVALPRRPGWLRWIGLK